MKIENLVEESRPREIARREGISKLNDIQLLALLIAGGIPGHSALEIANDMLMESGGLASLLTYSLAELRKFKGIGETKATQLLALFEIVKRSETGKGSFPSKCDKEALYRYFHDESKPQEEVIVVLLSPSLKMIGHRLVYKGDSSSTTFKEEDILRIVYQNGARHFILLHNHPSGNPNPSFEDLKAVGRLEISSSRLGLTFVDFVILGDGDCYSYRESQH